MIASSTIHQLKTRFRGELIGPDDQRYDSARAVFNASIDRRPALIARCASHDDVIQAVNFAREENLLVAVRGTGHNVAGFAVCDDGLVIDLSHMKGITVDPQARTVRVEGGCNWGEVNDALQPHGLAATGGFVSVTGVSGLTLGGGLGWLVRKHGLALDNLLSAEVVLADGRLVTASASENDDLFWAIRGGGGNFGVVTQFEFALHPVGPDILAGLIVFPYAQAKQILNRYRQFAAKSSEDLNVWVVLRQAPPLPFLPQEVHGKEVVVLPIFYAGKISEGQNLINQLRAFGDAHGEHVGVQPYMEWQKAFDPLLTPGARNYWKSHNFTELSDGAIDSIIAYAGKLPSPQCEILSATLPAPPIGWRPTPWPTRTGTPNSC